MKTKLTTRKDKITVKVKSVEANDSGDSASVVYYKAENSGGSHENNIRVSQTPDGAVYFSKEDNGEDFIYLYPQQVKVLKKLLRKEE